MFLGAVVGWGILAPVAKANGWAPGDVEDWEHGSRGWIMWISLAILVGDTVVSLSWFVVQPFAAVIATRLYSGESGQGSAASHGSNELDQGDEGAPLLPDSSNTPIGDARPPCTGHDVPPQHLISNRVLTFWFLGSIVLCLLSTSIIFGKILPLYETATAIAITLPLSVVGVRAMGETDFSPISGISK
jgi:hypothetical protein